MAGKPLKVEIKVVRRDEVIPYEALTEEEKAAMAKRLNQRAIGAVARMQGCQVEFIEEPPRTGIA